MHPFALFNGPISDSLPISIIYVGFIASQKFNFTLVLAGDNSFPKQKRVPDKSPAPHYFIKISSLNCV
jgi:hypothetical protein